MLRAVDRLLTASGFRVIAFASGEACLASDEWRHAACILMDIRLGRRSGLDVFVQMSAGGLRAPVIFVTAYDDAHTRERAMRAGASAYLTKPFSEGTLAAAIASALGCAKADSA